MSGGSWRDDWALVWAPTETRDAADAAREREADQRRIDLIRAGEIVGTLPA